jgi:hypothetical protein
MCERDGLADPMSLASKRVARKPGENGRKAGDVVTDQTCESPGERLGGWKPIPQGWEASPTARRAVHPPRYRVAR